MDMGVLGNIRVIVQMPFSSERIAVDDKNKNKNGNKTNMVP